MKMLLFLRSFITSFLAHSYQMLFAVTIGMVCVYFWPVKIIEKDVLWFVGQELWNSNQFFHFFHFVHIGLAAATAVLTVFRLTHKLWFAVLFGSIFPAIFCTISDILLPYLGALILGVRLQLHLCLVCNTEAMIIFIIMGVCSAVLCTMLISSSSLIRRVIAATHFLHGITGTIAALIYIAGFGFLAWTTQLFYIFLLLIFAVTLPCLFSDFILPNFVVKLLGISHPGHCCGS